MIIDQINELKQTEAKVATMKKEIAAAVAAKLASMHKEVGMKSTDELINALRSMPKRGPRKKRAPRKKGARLTPAQRSDIADAIKSGSLKGAAASKKFGVSVATIQKIKKDFGLVKSRAQKPAEAAAKTE